MLKRLTEITTNYQTKAESNGPQECQLLRTGVFDPGDGSGNVSVTAADLDQLVENFNSRVRGVDIAIDQAHKPDEGAAGWIQGLTHSNGKLYATIRWTSQGLKLIQEKIFKYLSAEFVKNWTNPETKEKHGFTLFGAGLTNRPVVKDLQPVTFSELKNIYSLHGGISNCERSLNDLTIKLMSETGESYPVAFQLAAKQRPELYNAWRNSMYLSEHVPAVNQVTQKKSPGPVRMGATLDKAAKLFMEKQPGITYGEALSMIAEAVPSAWEQYRNEVKGQ